jgi:uncharacterized protein with ParB-like and HNH nuclease domain/predicted transport protein
MKATEASFIQFLQGNDKQFIIPIYQRTYSWTIPQCKQLWEDILRVAQRSDIPGHFIGSIVYISKGIYTVSSVQQLLVIDGQQRLTTLSLLLLALSKAVAKDGSSKEITEKKLRSYYLLNNDEDGDLHYRLLLTQSDRETLMRLLKHQPQPAKHSQRIMENYAYFEKLIQETSVGLDILFLGISKLLIVDVSLDRTQDNPQLIFESLNSTGLELSQADLIRNYILMGLEPKEQTELYERYWYPMEQSFGHNESSNYFNRFMRDFLTIKNKGRIPRIEDVYAEFKAYLRSQPSLTVRDVVADVYRYCQYFIKLAFETEQDREIKAALKDINTLKVDVAYPFLLEVFDDYEHKRIQHADLLAILRMVESYIFRRVICGIPTNSLNKTFATLYREIDPAHYLESLQAAFLVKDSYRRYPGDEEFRQQFVIKDVYNFRSRNYLLRKLENAQRTKELVNVEDYTIEHILPQNEHLPAEWQKMLGPNWQQVQARYVHTIGNLTLTGYNSEYSDLPFPKKRDYPQNKGFRNSPLFLNQSLARLERWNEAAIQARAQGLADQAVQIWGAPHLAEAALNRYRQAKGKDGDEDNGQVIGLDHYDYLKGHILDLYHVFRHRVLNLDASVREELKKTYIAFKSVTNFVDIEPQRSRLRLSLNMPFQEINDPKGMCKDITGLGRWGNGDVEVGLASEKELDDVMELVQQALDWQTDRDG